MTGEGLSALLIDDSRLDYLHTRSLLLGSRAAVARLAWLDAWPGADAALADGPFDLFLVDLHLGACSGLDVIAELRRAGVLAPIIALTGLADEAIDDACTEAGASDFLVKGRFDRQELERSIRYAQRQADVHRELDRLNAALSRRATAEGDHARLMRFAIEQSSDAIFLSKAAPTIDEQPVVYVNAAASRLLSRRAGDLLGASVGDLLVDRIPALDEAIGRREAFLGDAALKGANARVEAMLQATPLSSDDGVTHYVWNGRGAGANTASPRGGRQRLRLETVGRVASGIVHALNDRLTAIVGNLERIEAKAGANEGLARPVAAAVRAAGELVAEVRLLDTFAHHRAATSTASFDPAVLLVAIEPLLRHAVGALARITLKAAPMPCPTVFADASPLQEALVLLVAWLAVGGDGVRLAVVTDDATTGPDVVRLRLEGRRGAVAGGFAEWRDIEMLVREAGGTLSLERPDDERMTAFVDLPRG